MEDVLQPINILDQKTKENESIYTDAKAKLEEILGKASSEYGALLKDYKGQIAYIQNDNMVTKEGKLVKSKEIQERFIGKAHVAMVNHYESLHIEIDIALKKDEIRKLENMRGLTPEMLPQLIYVNSMLNSISSVNDVDLLDSVFSYSSLDGNFSDEIINMVNLKARNLLNNVTPATQEGTNNEKIMAAMNSAGNNTKLNKIIEKINKYKVDYSKDLKIIRDGFKRDFNQKKYPSSLYMSKDPKQDFSLPGQLNPNDPWNR